jgi:hypothetical protein
LLLILDDKNYCHDTPTRSEHIIRRLPQSSMMGKTSV